MIKKLKDFIKIILILYSVPSFSIPFSSSTLLPPLSFVWKFEIPGTEIVSSPLTYKGIVYFGARDTSIYAVDMYSGEQIWQYSTDNWVDAGCCVYNNKVYIASRDGKVYAFNYYYQKEIDPMPIWIYDTFSNLCSSPLIKDGKLYILTGYPKGEILVIDSEKGQLINSYNISSFSFSSPVIKDNYLVAGTNSGKYHCINLNTATEFSWSPYQTSQNPEYTAPVISDDNKLFIATKGDKTTVIAIELSTGKKLWESNDISQFLGGSQKNYTTASSPVLGDNKIYISYGYNVSQFVDRLKLVCIDAVNGNILYISDEIGSPHSSGIIATPVISGNVIYVPSGNGNLYVIDTSTLGIITNYSFGSPILTKPVISNGYIYFADMSGKFYSYTSDNIVSIISPAGDDVVYKIVNITGTVKHSQFKDYSIQYKSISQTTYYTIISSDVQKTNSILGTWDCSGLTDGEYILRLVMSTISGATYYALNSININNPPRPPSSLIAVNNTEGLQPKILLNWTKSPDDGEGVNDVLEYHIYRSSVSFSYDITPIAIVSSKTVQYNDEQGLIQGLTYYYIIRSYDNLNESINSNQASAVPYDNVSPQPVKNLVSVKTQEGYVKLNWDKSPDDGSGVNDVVSYFVYRTTASTIYTEQSIINILSAGTTVYIDTNVVSNIDYYYIVRAKDHNNNLSLQSNETAIKITVSPPVNLSYYLSDGNINLNWTKSIDDTDNGFVSKYYLYKSTVQGQYSAVFVILEKGTTHYTDTTIMSNVDYFYVIRSLDRYGNISSVSNEISTKISLPSPVTSFNSTIQNGEIVLNWTKSADDGQGINHVQFYKIYRSTVSGNYSTTPLQTLSNGTSLWIDNSVVSNIDYFYIIYAVDKFGNFSNKSSEIKTKIPLPACVSSLVGTVIEDSIVLNWTKSADDGQGINHVSGYNIYRSTVSGEYRDVLKLLNKGSVSYTDKDLYPDTVYYYVIRVIDKYGNYSTLSNEISVKVPNVKPPENLWFDIIDGGYIKINWTKSADDGVITNLVEAYCIYKSSVSNVFDYTKFIYLPKGTTTYTDTDIITNKDYYYIIRSCDKKGNFSVNSTQIIAKVPLASPVKNLSYYTTIFENRENIVLNWTKSADDGQGINHVSGYNIYRSTVSGNYIKPIANLYKGTTYFIDTDTNVIINMDYYYVVCAVDRSNNISELSNEIKAKIVSEQKFIDNSKHQTAKLITNIGVVEVEFEPQSINKSDTLIIRQVSTKMYSSKTNVFYEAWEFKFVSPDTQLTDDVTIKLPYNKNKIITENINEKLLRVIWFNNEKNKWDYLNTSNVISGENRVKATVNHFSVFGIGIYNFTGKLLEEKEVYTYPNPAKSTDRLYFKFKIYDVFDKIDIKIFVYTISQQLIWYKEELFYEDSAGLVKEISWDISNIASGIYVYKIKASSGEFNKTITKKLAIIK